MIEVGDLKSASGGGATLAHCLPGTSRGHDLRTSG